MKVLSAGKNQRFAKIDYFYPRSHDMDMNEQAKLFPPLSNCKVLLASQSPRRRELLGHLDVDVEILPLIEVSEAYPATMKPEEVPAYISKKKAHPYMSNLKEGEVLLTADTVVICSGEVIGKPTDPQDAARILRLLSGRTHKVVTGVTLATTKRTVTFSETTEVDFAPLTIEEIDYYLNQYRPLDKAGAYGIQEWIGYIGIRGIRGDYYNVMGLPLHNLYTHLLTFAHAFRHKGNK